MFPAAPCHILSAVFAVYPPLKPAAAFRADNFPGERIPVQIFFAAFCDPLLQPPLIEDCPGSLKILTADDRFMVALHQVLVFLPIVRMLPYPKAAIQ